MKLRSLFVEAFITGFSGAAMPGPVLAAGIVLAAAGGFWTGPLLVFGHFVVELALVLALAAGLRRVFERPDSPLVRGIGLVGGFVLLLMAFDMLRSLPALSLQGVSASGAYGSGPLAAISAGAVTTAANPYFWVWWATIGLGLLTHSTTARGRLGLTAFYSGHILSDLAWYSLVAFLIAGGKGLLSDTAYRALIGLCAVFLAVFGARFLLAGLRPRPIDPEAEAQSL